MAEHENIPGLAARKAALALIGRVIHDKMMLSEAESAAGPEFHKLAPGERARASRLADLVFRNIDRLDHVLEKYMKSPPPFAVHLILRLAAAEMLCEDTPAHAAVDAAVRLTKQRSRTQAMAGLVNAVSRRVSREGADHFAAAPATQLPEQMRKALLSIYGEATLAGIEAQHAIAPAVDLTLKDPTQAETLAKSLDAEILPNGSLRVRRGTQISAFEGYDRGEWWVQDAAASLPAQILGAQEGEDVLDLCAAPGGKTMQLSAMGATVTALDVSQKRLKRVWANLRRTDLSAAVVAADATKWTPDQKFDAILLDAPCSATGTIRRHPELPLIRSKPDLGSQSRLQRQLIMKAAQWLKPGGRLVYATCSLYTKEGEDQRRWALETTPLKAEAIDPAPFGLPQEASIDGALRLRPDFWQQSGGMDGFYIAKFTRLP